MMCLKCIFLGLLLASIDVNVKCSNVPVYSSYSVTNDVLDDNDVVSDSVYGKGSNFYNYYENLKEDKVDANVDISSNAGSCTSDRLVVYKAVLHTYWSRELFPKHYPDWRPTAQWTKTIGELSFFYGQAGLLELMLSYVLLRVCFFAPLN